MIDLQKILEEISALGLSVNQNTNIKNELEQIKKNKGNFVPDEIFFDNIYSFSDSIQLQSLKINNDNPISNLQTLEELLERDNLREKDGFHRRIKLGKFILYRW